MTSDGPAKRDRNPYAPEAEPKARRLLALPWHRMPGRRVARREGISSVWRYPSEASAGLAAAPDRLWREAPNRRTEVQRKEDDKEGKDPSSPILHRHIPSLRRPRIDLPRPPNPRRRILPHLEELRQPPGQPPHREQHREHVHRDADRLVNDAGVEVDVRVEAAARRSSRPSARPPRAGPRCPAGGSLVFMPVEDVVARLLDDLRPRVEVLVDPVAEAHEARWSCRFLTFSRVRKLGAGADPRRSIRSQHLDHRLVGAAVERAPERG